MGGFDVGMYRDTASRVAVKKKSGLPVVEVPSVRCTVSASGPRAQKTVRLRLVALLLADRSAELLTVKLPGR